MTDLRLLGKVGYAQTVDSLSGGGRLILCSADYARVGGRVLWALPYPEYASVFAAYPKEKMTDGNRNSLMMVTDVCEYVEVVLELPTSRKTLLQLDYLQGEDLQVTAVSMSNDVVAITDPASVSWTSIYSGLKEHKRSERHVLYVLPYKNTVEQTTGQVKTATSGVAIAAAGISEADDYWIGAYAIPQSGANTGIPRRVVDWDEAGANSVLTVEYPFPHGLVVGVTMLVKRFAANYLSNQFMKIKIERLYANSLPLKIAGLSVADFLVELKGDQDGFRSVVAPNPGEFSRKGGNFIMKQTLGPLPILEEPAGGLKEHLTIQWGAAYAGFYDVLRDWQSAGFCGLVDLQGRFMMGVARDPSARRLFSASNIQHEEDNDSIEFSEA